MNKLPHQAVLASTLLTHPHILSLAYLSPILPKELEINYPIYVALRFLATGRCPTLRPPIATVYHPEGWPSALLAA